MTPTPLLSRFSTHPLAWGLRKIHPIWASLLAGGVVHAQSALPAVAPESVPTNLGWQVCQAMTGQPAAQLKCFQDWATSQVPRNMPQPEIARAPANPATGQPATPVLLLPSLNTEAPDGKPIGCRNDTYSGLSRFWELQRGTDCDTFAIRGFRPFSLSLVTASSVNVQPSAPGSAGASLAPPPAQSYGRNETKIQLSVRTKLAKGLFQSSEGDDSNHDSLWFAYTQKSYWQLFNAGLSRPFRANDYEPELIYIYAHQIPLAGGWNYRLSGLGLVHQSNGQSLPLSRSWNRVYLMGAAEKILGPDSSLQLQGRIWDRLRETKDDDNPGIENYIGRAELVASWQINKANSLGLTVLHSLRRQARGSTRIDWLVAPGSAPNYTGLRYHLQLFHGYGDSLLDYNQKRTKLSVGLSLEDW